MNHTILLTFDVEDWFQVENFKQYIPFACWPNYELRVEKNVHKILDLLDSIKLNNSTNLIKSRSSVLNFRDSKQQNSNTAIQQNIDTRSPVLNPSNSPNALRLVQNDLNSSLNSIHSAACGNLKATFFVLGWIAKQLPHLVREIQSRGHEVASHGYDHRLCKEQSAEDLKEDLIKSKKLLEDIAGVPIYGYRAPNFSINHDILKTIEDTGYLYDSSLNSFRLNKRYGQVELGATNSSKDISLKVSNKFYELPVSNLRIGKQVFPWGGGGYFRLIPLQLFKHGVKTILKKHGTYLFYLHPWEIDPEQPKVTEAQMFFKFRHYLNLSRTLNRLSFLIRYFGECYFQTCYQYLSSHEAADIAVHVVKPYA